MGMEAEGMVHTNGNGKIKKDNKDIYVTFILGGVGEGEKIGAELYKKTNEGIINSQGEKIKNIG